MSVDDVQQLLVWWESCIMTLRWWEMRARWALWGPPEEMRTYKTGRDFQPLQCLFQTSVLCKSALKWKTPSLNLLGLPLSQALHLELFQTVVPLVLRNLLPTSRLHLFMNNLHLLIFLLVLSGFYPSLLSRRWLTGLLLSFICHRIFQSPQWDKHEHITRNLYNSIYLPLSSASVSSHSFQDWLCASCSLVKKGCFPVAPWRIFSSFTSNQ